MFKKIAAAAALTLVASAAFAAPTGFYGGADVGSTRADGLDLNSSKASYGAFLGYGVNDNIGVELGYRRLGQWDDAYGAGNDATINQTHLSVVASVPLKDQFSVFARVGYNKLNGAAETSSGALYGVGVGYDFNQRVFGRVEVQKPSNFSNNIGVSVGYKF
jgi:OOP family OmpA-OmpF porin